MSVSAFVLAVAALVPVAGQLKKGDEEILLANLKREGAPSKHTTLIIFSSDAKTAASATWFLAKATEQQPAEISLFDVATGKSIATLKGHTESLTWMGFTPDGKTLASCSMDGTVRLWQTATGAEVATIAHRGWPFGGWAFSRDSKTLALAAGDGPIRLWETTTGKSLGILRSQPPTSEAWSLAFSPDGKTLASGHRANSYVKLWDLAARKEIANLEGHTQDCYAGVHSLAFSPDGKTLASAGGEVKLWEVARLKNNFTLKGQAKVEFSPDGKSLATANTDMTVRLWDPSTGKARAALGGSKMVRPAAWAFSPDSKVVAIGAADGLVGLWDIATAKLLGHRKLHAQEACSLAFTPDSKTLVSGGLDGTVKLWTIGR